MTGSEDVGGHLRIWAFDDAHAGTDLAYGRESLADALREVERAGEPSQALGRGQSGGNPGGLGSTETLDWYKERVEAHSEEMVVMVHHYVLKNTTVALGGWECVLREVDGEWGSHYHGYYPEGTPSGPSSLYWVGGRPDAQLFEHYLDAHSGSVGHWLEGRTHTHPNDTAGGKYHIERRWGGTWFLDVAALTGHHVDLTVPMSRQLTFTTGSDAVRVQFYLHTFEYAPQGWNDAAERTLWLSPAFEW